MDTYSSCQSTRAGHTADLEETGDIRLDVGHELLQSFDVERDIFNTLYKRAPFETLRKRTDGRLRLDTGRRPGDDNMGHVSLRKTVEMEI
jgi:hypothetical protein